MSVREVRMDLIMDELYICPGCRTKGEHKCHERSLYPCDCPDCKPDTWSMAARRCACKQCKNDRAIRTFLDTYSEEEQKAIHSFLNFRENEKG